MGSDYLVPFGDTGHMEGRSTESYQTLRLRNNSIHYRLIADWIDSCLGHGVGSTQRTHLKSKLRPR